MPNMCWKKGPLKTRRTSEREREMRETLSEELLTCRRGRRSISTRTDRACPRGTNQRRCGLLSNTKVSPNEQSEHLNKLILTT